MHLQFSIIVLIVIFLKAEATTDPCKDYMSLDDPDRSAAYLGESPYLCDASIDEGWYRAVSGAGGNIPMSPVPAYRCGTQFPIWMDDSLPQIDTQTQVKLCVHHDVFGECYQTIYINVKNCGGEYNVYELKQTSGCPMRYCFGTELKCPDDQFSDTGFGPICEVVPDIPPPLNVTAALIEETEKNIVYNRLKFHCNFKSVPDYEVEVRYRVEWFIETISVAIFSDKTLSEIPEIYLSEKYWAKNFTMGFNVKCKMRVKFATGTVYGQSSESDFFHVGFKAEPSKITVKEGQAVDVKISLTVPFGCVRLVDTDAKECFLYIKAREPEYQQDLSCENDFESDPVMFDNDNCGVTFEDNLWNTPQTLKVIGQSDRLVNDGDEHYRITYVKLKALFNSGHEAWSYAYIPDITVHVSDGDTVTQGKMCKSNNDPRITTFDGKKYDNQKAGEFVLFKHNVQMIQVNVVNVPCTEFTGYCACGVAIRHDDNLFVANFCGHVSKEYISGIPRNRYIERVKCDDKKMTIEHTGRIYKLILPTGEIVSFEYDYHDVLGWWIPYVHITPSIFDWEQSAGLCGVFDGDSSNDFTLRNGADNDDQSRFINDWRVPPESSLFTVGLELQPQNVQLRQYCKCRDEESETAISCHLDAAMVPCTNKKVDANAVDGYYRQCADDSRKKREASYHYINKREAETDEDVFQKINITFSDDYLEEPNMTVSWQNGWTEESARQKCKDHFEGSQMITLCNKIVQNFDKSINATILECMEDIKVSGGDSFLKASLASLSNACLREAEMQENLTKSNSSSGNSSKSLLDNILDTSCPNNCSDQGTCEKGECQCLDGFYGTECNLKRTDAPSVDRTLHTGICKTNEKPCRSYGITVSNVIPGFLCKARHFKVIKHDEGTRVDVNPTDLIFSGTYINEFSCKCRISNSRRRRSAESETVFADGYHISVSNDGVTYSEEITFVNFDSTCYECNSTDITCTLIGDYDACTTTNTPSITKIPQPEPTKDINVGLTVGLAALGVVIVVAVIVAVTCFIHKHANNSAVDSGSVPERNGVINESLSLHVPRRNEMNSAKSLARNSIISTNAITIVDLDSEDLDNEVY